MGVEPVLPEPPAPPEVRAVGPPPEEQVAREVESVLIESVEGPKEIEPLPESPAPELPESYGTGSLELTPRDPHWIHAHWDLGRAQIDHYRSFAEDGRLALKVYQGPVAGDPCATANLPAEAPAWFVHVGRGGVEYTAQLGYVDMSGQWQAVATSAPVSTPSEAEAGPPAREGEAPPVGPAPSQLATIPIDVPLRELRAQVREFGVEEQPLATAIESLYLAGHLAHPAPLHASVPWKPEFEAALAGELRRATPAAEWVGSEGIPGLLRGWEEWQPRAERGPGPGPLEGGRLGPAQPAIGISSAEAQQVPPAAEAGQPGKQFWFNINAELVIYGATEPDARVSVGGRKVHLRPDGTFSLRYALPDGRYQLAAVAISASNDDGRSARLEFARRTDYWGAAPAAPDPGLKPPID